MLSHQQWSRAQQTTEQLQDHLKTATHVLVLISDDAIEPFIIAHRPHNHSHQTWIHCSGSLTTQYAIGAHPLQTFPSTPLYTLELYQQIPFIIDPTDKAFDAYLPGLPNPSYTIDLSNKAYYHAMCVLANNVSTLLWQKFYQEMQQRFGIDQRDLQPFLISTLNNIKDNPDNALTGPIARRDHNTLKRNATALQGDAFESIFNAVVQTFTPEENP